MCLKVIDMKGDNMSIEFNGDIKFNKADAVLNLKKKDDSAGSNLTQIGDLLGAKGNQNTAEIVKEINLTDILSAGGFPKKLERTPEQKEALAELNKKVSSTGISYGEATAKIDEIREKYNDDKYFKEVTIRDNQPKNFDKYMMDIEYLPIKQKVFDESKLPEPARTEYREAMAAKEEIENNNAALAKKAAIYPSGHTKPPVAGRDADEVLAAVVGESGLKPEEPTEKQKAARAKLDEKQSSTGVKYKDAKAVIAQLTEKYKDSCRSEFESKQPTGILIYIMPYEAFDPYKIPEPDKTAYFDALAVITEIEQQNSALLQQAGLSMTPQPNRNYAGKHFELY